MSEHSGHAASPVPAEPSAASLRLRQRMTGARGMHERATPSGLSLRTLRASTAATALFARMPRGVAGRSVRYPDDVHGRLVTVDGENVGEGIVLWLHGGGFVAGAPHSHEKLVAPHCAESGLPIFLPRYRRAPEHPFPAAADDVLAAYRALLRHGYAAENIRIAGDSSGAALTVGLLGDLTRERLPMPGAALLLSPLLDFDVAGAGARDAIRRDPWVSPGFIERTNRAYTATTPLSEPRLDLLGADMRSWPPTLAQLGDTECIADDAARLRTAMHAAHARCEVQLWPGQMHGFALFGDKLPESTAAREYACLFLRDRG